MMSAYPTGPADPRLQDGSDGPSSRDLAKELLRTLHSACCILDRLDAEGVQSLRDDPQYVAMLEHLRLMAPMGLSAPATGSQKGQTSLSAKAAHPSDDGQSRTKRTSTSFVFRWRPLVMPKASSSSEPRSVSVSKGISINEVSASAAKYHGASDSKQATPAPLNPPESGASTSPVSPIKRLQSSDSSTQLDLAQQYEIIQTLINRASTTSWTNATVSSCGPSENPIPVTPSDPQMVYLVSRYWWDWFHKAYVHAKDPAVKALGIKYTMDPVDNRSLSFVEPAQAMSRRRGGDMANNNLFRLRMNPYSSILESTHFICVPREVWENCLVEWYGNPSHPFILPLEKDYEGLTVGIPSDLHYRAPNLSLSSDWQPGARWKVINNLICPWYMLEEEMLYLISIKWWTCWRMREAGMPGTDSGGDSVRMAPPIDNSDLLAKHMEASRSGRVLPLDMKAEVDFVVVPIAAWHLLRTWFGFAHQESDVLTERYATLKSLYAYTLQIN